MRAQIHHFGGIKSAVISTDAPALILEGKNGSGKTSTVRALRYAISGILLNARAANAFKHLDSAKTDEMRVIFDCFEWTGQEYRFSGTEGENGNSAPAYAVGITALADMRADERIIAALQAHGKEGGNSVEDWIEENPKYAEHADAIAAAIGDGEDDEKQVAAAHNAARDEARRAKAKWEKETGERYGSLKAANYPQPRDADERGDLRDKVEAGFLHSCHQCGASMRVDGLNALVDDGGEDDVDSLPTREEWLEANNEMAEDARRLRAHESHAYAEQQAAIIAATDPASGIGAHYRKAALDRANQSMAMILEEFFTAEYAEKLHIDDKGGVEYGDIPIEHCSRAERWIANAAFQLYAAKRHNAHALIFDDADMLSFNNADAVLRAICAIGKVWGRAVIIAGADIASKVKFDKDAEIFGGIVDHKIGKGE